MSVWGRIFAAMYDRLMAAPEKAGLTAHREALIGGAGFTSEAAVIAPSILIDDLELHPIEEELPKLPVVPAPTLAVK